MHIATSRVCKDKQSVAERASAHCTLVSAISSARLRSARQLARPRIDPRPRGAIVLQESDFAAPSFPTLRTSVYSDLLAEKQLPLTKGLSAR